MWTESSPCVVTHTTTGAAMPENGPIIGERTIERRMVRPRLVTTKEVVEKVVVIPETRVKEEVVEENVMVREKIVEIAKPCIQEKLVRVNVVDFVERSVEFPEIIHQERTKTVPHVSLEEEIVEVIKQIPVEKIVAVPEVEYQTVPVERIVEIVEYEDHVITKQIPVDEYVEVIVHQDKLVQVEQEYECKIPQPVDRIVEVTYQLPLLRSVQKVVPVEYRIPRFIEVPVPSAFLYADELRRAEDLQRAVTTFIKSDVKSYSTLERILTTAAAEAQLVRPSFAKDSEAVTVVACTLEREIEKLSPEDLGPLPRGVIHYASLPNAVIEHEPTGHATSCEA